MLIVQYILIGNIKLLKNCLYNINYLKIIKLNNTLYINSLKEAYNR
jgi:hypothetical protein